eukprot:TRINITY_DN3625_c0_g8_i1.p1 TRINITY_DN3625_c0_g8~~TRINITY_DN3625_c0_g8_i1.p1  ORF type:complete len:334 (-),score=34.07 TRINITY_DN3625_c0_g8_i1:261-1262(-)
MENCPQVVQDIRALEKISYDVSCNPISTERNKATLKKFIGQLHALTKSVGRNSKEERGGQTTYKKYVEYKKLSEQLDKENAARRELKSFSPEKLIVPLSHAKVPRIARQHPDVLKQLAKQNWSVSDVEGEKKHRGQSLSKSHFSSKDKTALSKASSKKPTLVKLVPNPRRELPRSQKLKTEEAGFKLKYLKNTPIDFSHDPKRSMEIGKGREHMELAYSTACNIDKLMPKLLATDKNELNKQSVVEMANNFLSSSIISHFARGCATPGTVKSQLGNFVSATGKISRRKSRIWEDKILEEESSYATTENNCNYSATSYTSSNVSISAGRPDVTQ